MAAPYSTPQQVHGKPPGSRMQPQQPPLIPSSLPFPSQRGMMTGNYGFSGHAGYSPPSIYGYPPYGNYGYPAYSPPCNCPITKLFDMASGSSIQSRAPLGTRPAPQYSPMMGPGMYGPPFQALTGSGLGGYYYGAQSLPRDYLRDPYPYMPATTVDQTKTSSNTCPNNKNVMVFGPKGTYLKFHYNSKIGKIVQHKCVQCTGKVSEKDLCKLYSKWYEPISNYVLFVENDMTSMIEQYIFSPKTGGFEQVNYPELKYNSSEDIELSKSASIQIYKSEDKNVFLFLDDDGVDYSRKEYIKDGQWNTIPEVPVKTLLMKEMEDKKSDEEEEEDEDESVDDVADENEYSEYLRTLPPFKTRYCSTTRNDVVFILSPNGSYSKFYFCKITQEYESHYCTACKDFVTEYHLIPKYSVYSNTVKTYVFHCKNTETSRMEQYIYDEKTQGFEQVYLPELKYSSSMDTRSNTLLVLNGNNSGATLIMRDTNTGKFIKEKYCLKTNQFVQLPIEPVRTISVKIIESENQKKTEESKIQKTSVKDSEEAKIQKKTLQNTEESKTQEKKTSVKNSAEPKIQNKEDSEESPQDVDDLIQKMNECMKQFSLLNDKMTIALKREEQMKQLTITIDENQDSLLNSQKQHQAIQLPE